MKYILFFVFCLNSFGQTLDNKFINALIQVESRGNVLALGDYKQGVPQAIGCLQIHKAYWQDAVSFDKSIGGKYSDLTNQAYSEKVMNAYFRRYAPKALASHDYETLARIHNGGVSGATNPNTIKYWLKVKKYLDNH